MADMTTHSPDKDRLERSMSNRHLQMIAIGGAIGTGLFLGAGGTISSAGPSIIVVYAVIGAFLFLVMRAMGEILLSNLAYKSFADFATDLIGPWAGFYVGWTYWICWVIIAIADTQAVTVYVQYWWPSTPRWVPVAVMLIVLYAINIAAARAYGEMEFWFSLIKVLTIVALIVIGIGLIVVGYQSGTGAGATHASITHLWDVGGLFPKGLGAFIAAFPLVSYSYQGIEMVGIAAAETANPRKTLPQAVNAVPLRILIFYVLALAVIMCVVPWNQLSKDNSPFVMLFQFVGIGIAAGVLNFVCLTAAASSANSGMYSTSRLIYGLSRQKDAPERYSHLSKRHVPSRALTLTFVCTLPAVVIAYLSGSAANAFTYVANVSAILYFTVWGLIMVCYLKYLKKFPERHDESKFRLPGGKIAAWAVIIFFICIFVLLAFDSSARVYLMAVPVWFLVLGILWKLLETNRAQAVAVDYNAERVLAEQAAHESE